MTKTAPYTHHKSIESWPIYILSGVLIPILFCYIYENSKIFIINIIHEINRSNDKKIPH